MWIVLVQNIGQFESKPVEFTVVLVAILIFSDGHFRTISHLSNGPVILITANKIYYIFLKLRAFNLG